MKRFMMLAVAVAAMLTFGVGETQAQMRGPSGWGAHNFGHAGIGRPGYRRGIRGGYGFYPAFNDFYNPYSFNRPETQPYFAMNPPVYYSNRIVRRPMGISPFPAPPGVTPVEMTIQTQPQVMTNPYFKNEAQPVTSGKLDKDTDT